MISEVALAERVDRIVTYINSYRSSLGRTKRFPPVKIRKIFVTDNNAIDYEAVECLSWLLGHKTIANNILWMKCNLSFQQASTRRELVVVDNSFISSENRNEIVEAGKARIRKNTSCGKVVASSRVWNDECESGKDYSSLSKKSRAEKSQAISRYIQEKFQIKEADMDLLAEDLMSPQKRLRLSSSENINKLISSEKLMEHDLID